MQSRVVGARSVVHLRPFFKPLTRMPFTRSTLISALLGVAFADAAAAHALAGRQTLAQILTRARLVVAGEVTTLTPYDSGRLTVARVRVRRALKGAPEGNEILIVERHDLPSSPELLRPTEQVVVFLVAAARTSSLRQALPAATYYELVVGRAGVISSASASEVEEAVEIVARLMAAGGTPVSAAQQRATGRKLVFDEIAVRHAAIVADGVAGLGKIADLATTLNAEERQRLETALGRADLPVWLRVGLVNTIGERGLKALIPALRTLPDLTLELQRAVWSALTRLGAAPTEKDLSPALSSSDPALRAAAVQALLAGTGDAALARVSQLALTDPDHEVRRAALDALGEARLPAALPSLEQAFASPEADLRQAAGRAIFTIGGQPAADSLVRLAFEGQPEAQHYAVLLLLLSGTPHDDPRIERIRATHPSPEIRRLVDEGIEFHEH